MGSVMIGQMADHQKTGRRSKTVLWVVSTPERERKLPRIQNGYLVLFPWGNATEA